MSDALLLFANLGSEEGPADGASSRPQRERARDLWRLLFPHGSVLSEGDAAPWPEGLREGSEHSAFRWLPPHSGGAGLVPWLSDDAAQALAREHQRALLAAPPALAAAVHDKAFSARLCAAERLEARPLRGLRAVLEPEELRAPGALEARVRSVVREWPEWARANFTVKPRFGTSGRGRIAGANGELRLREDAAAAGERLAQRGGAIVEAWLERLGDLSAQLWIPPPETDAAREPGTAQQADSAQASAPASGARAADAPIVFAATLVALCSPSGVPLGHCGEIDSRGRVFSGSEFEEDLRELAATLAGAARAAGYWGPCGVDAAVFEHDGRRWLQPLELNARYTLGLTAAGIARRALPRFRESLGLDPGDRNGFAVQLAPGTGDTATARAQQAQALGSEDPGHQPQHFRIALAPESSAPERPAPQLVGTRDPAAIKQIAG